MRHAMSSVCVVVVCGGDGTAGTFVLTDRPVLDVSVSAVDGADLVAAAIAGDGAHLLALTAGVVRAVVLENLFKCETRVRADILNVRY